MTAAQRRLVEVLRATKEFLALPGNDFAWSQWDDADQALREIDEFVVANESGVLPERMKLKILFAPTGSIQEVSVSSGGGMDFLTLAQQFDTAEIRVYDTFGTRLKSWFGLK